MKLFVRLVVFAMCLFLPAAVVLVKSDALQKQDIAACFIMVVVGWFFSHQAMDAVAGKLPKDEQ